MKKIRNLVCLLLMACLALPAMAQQVRTIKGVVLDETGETVIGASVSVPGTSVGAATDLNGGFSINNVPATQKTLTVGYLGYQTQTVDITDKTEVNVTLVPATSELDEVVIVGYGAQKKAHLTGSVATVAPSEILDLSVTSLGAALDGLINGVSVNETSNRPGEPARIEIRNGNQTVTATGGTLTPLYVIDDYIADENAFNNLDASMIENISVLKDASAAIYGARSAQGVVLVKTKRGQVGKPKISYNGQFGYTDEFYRSKMMDSYNFGLTWNAVRAADPTNTWNAKNDLFQQDELGAMKALNYDLLDQYWSSALTQKHSVNVSGGSENATYFGGVSYVTQDGNLGRIDYDRWNYRVGADAKINSWTKAALQVSGDYGQKNKAYVKVASEADDTDYSMLLLHPRYIPEYLDGLPIAGYGVTNGSLNAIQNYNYSVVENDLGNFSADMPQNMTINSSLEFDFGWNKFLQGLKIKATYSKSIGTTKSNQYGSDYTLWQFADNSRGGSGSHLYTDTEGYPMNFDGMSKVPVSNGNMLRRNMSRNDSYQLNFIASYARSFGEHDVSGLFTIEKAESENETLWGMVTDPYSFTDFQSKEATGTQTTEFSRSEAGVLSYVGRLNYAYADKYLAEFLIRSDASTKFAPENYWGVFPSLSLGWVISQEEWFQDNVDFVNFFKIRGSYGVLGRDNIKAWAWLQTYGSENVKGPIFGDNPSKAAGSHIQYPKDVPNRNSHWDKSYKSNIGLDFNFLRSRLSVTLDGYYDRNRDVFMEITNATDYPTTVGASASASNFGATDNYGVELSLGWRDAIGDFKYHVKLNTGYTDNKIIKAPWGDAATRDLDAIQPNERADRGLWGYECIGMFRSNQEIAEYFAAKNISQYMGLSQADVRPGMLIYNDVRGTRKADGTYYAPDDPADPNPKKVDRDDRIKISERRGNPYGFTVNLGGEWKSLSFSAQIGASWGSYTMMPTAAISIANPNGTLGTYNEMQFTNLPSFWAGNMFVYEDVKDEKGNVVAHKNTEALYPNLRFSSGSGGVNSVTSTFWKVSNTTVALRNFTMAYTVPKAWINKMGIEGLRLNLTGQNLLSFYNPYPDAFMDPLANYGKYPILRKFTLGVSVSF